MTYQEIQAEIYANKVRRNFNVTDIGKEIFLMTEEFGELCHARITNNRELIIDSIGDIMVYCFGLAAMLKTNADELLVKKINLPEEQNMSNYLIYTGSSIGLMAKAYKHSNKAPASENSHVEEFIQHTSEILQYCRQMFRLTGVDEFKTIESIVRANETRSHKGKI